MAIISHVSASFTRPNNTTAYAANDLVANSETAGLVVPLTFTVPVGNGRAVELKELHISKSGTTVTNADFDLVLFHGDTAPTSSAGDNAAFISSNVYACNRGASFLGVVAGGQMLGFSDASSFVNALNQANSFSHVLHDAPKIYGFLVAQAGYAPAAQEVFTVTLGLSHNDG